MRNESVVDEHRNLFCCHYDACLDHAIHQKWLSFTCKQCPLRDVADTESQVQAYARKQRADSGSP